MIRILWSEESTEQLKALWASGLSASRIACQIPNATRNSILGKVHRLNLERRAPSPGGRIAQTREERNAKARATTAANRLMNKQLMNGYGPSHRVTHKRPQAIPNTFPAPHSPSLAPINGKARHMLPRLWKTRHAPPVAYAGEPVPITEATGCKFAVKSEGRTHLFCNAPCEGSWCEYHRCSVYGLPQNSGKSMATEGV